MESERGTHLHPAPINKNEVHIPSPPPLDGLSDSDDRSKARRTFQPSL